MISKRLLAIFFAIALLITGSAVIAQNQSGNAPDPSIPATPHWFMLSCAVLLLIVLLWRSGSLFLHERKKQRFAPVLSPAEIDETWLREDLFSMVPEKVGAVWDKKTSGHGMAAVLARMVVEKKMSSWLEPVMFPFINRHIPGRYTLYLSLLQPLHTFNGYEKVMVERLFINGNTTDTRRLKAYYRRKNQTLHRMRLTGKSLQKKLAVKRLDKLLEYMWLWMLIGLLPPFFIFLANGFVHPDELRVTIISGITGIIGLIAGSLIGGVYRRQVDGLRWKYLMVHLVPLFLLLFFLLLGYSGTSILLLSGLAFLFGTAIYSSFYFAKTVDSPERTVLRKKLLAIKKYFQKELQERKPALDDSWFPYLIALGLGSSVDSWSRRFGGTLCSGRSRRPSSAADGLQFSGGGGNFGGDAVGAWAIAAGSLCSYVGGFHCGSSALAEDEGKVKQSGKPTEKVVEGENDE
ncbi:hypothetical protein [Desulfopila inferna]|uniref:hypothetical protein n=1 Tax=Desulfopila inferna TaxID=468528 RepID=UPI00196506A0|nr:hypothetical protein [Desulfopila inferna]MBM9603619.1 hypothetical protein [Desulfopila inferna]